MNQLNATFSFISSLLLNSSLINSVIDMNSLNGPITFDESSSALNQAIKSLENIKVDNILLSQFKSLLNDFNEQINVLNWISIKVWRWFYTRLRIKLGSSVTGFHIWFRFFFSVFLLKQKTSTKTEQRVLLFSLET